MQSSDPRHFFESDAEVAKRERRAAKSSNKLGNPISLKSKILAAIPDPRAPSRSILVAEAAGCVRQVNLDNPDEPSRPTYRGPTTPVCSVAVGGPNNGTLFAGCWDKTIWSWDLATRVPGRKFVGHSDFVKAVVCATVGGKHVLISGGADKKIIVWDVVTGQRLHTLQDSAVNMLSVQDLMVDVEASTKDEISLVSASSDPHIRRWKIRLDGWERVPDQSESGPGIILEHETTVYRLLLDQTGDDVDLWTASGDGTAKCLSRAKGFAVEDTITHGDHVRAVAVTDQWVITAGRDEDVKVWDRASGKLQCSLVGHYDEVIDLVVLDGGARVCSVSLDGTVRIWQLDQAGLDKAVKDQEKWAAGEQEKKEEAPASLLSPEEEAELAALMEEDD